MRIAVVGAGAFGAKHLQALAAIDGVDVPVLVGRRLAQTRRVADLHGIAEATTDFDSVLARDDVDAVILCTPSQLHAEQAIKALGAGKHVQVEIPLADSLLDAERVVAAQRASGRVCMVGHTRRFNPSHQWIRARIAAGELALHQLEVQTYFMRRSNSNIFGEPRSWTDHLLWHHAAHTVDLFAYQTGRPIIEAHAVGGPVHPNLGIVMDMSVQLRTDHGEICSLSLSFHHEGPPGTTFRYISDRGTYIARYDDLVDSNQQLVDVGRGMVSGDGVELQDREFVTAITRGREPNSSVAQVLDCYRTLDHLERQLSSRVIP